MMLLLLLSATIVLMILLDETAKEKTCNFTLSKSLIQLRQTAHVYECDNNKIYDLSERLNPVRTRVCGWKTAGVCVCV